MDILKIKKKVNDKTMHVFKNLSMSNEEKILKRNYEQNFQSNIYNQDSQTDNKMVTFEYVDINKKINISDVDNNKDTL